MKYEKPVVEIINIENEDIVTDSSCGSNGSLTCLASGLRNQQNNYDLMVAGGACTSGRQGSIGDNGLFGAKCGFGVAGVSCSRNPGTYYPEICVSFLGIGQSSNCGRVAGANSLGDSDY